jgi:hypothetical protein
MDAEILSTLELIVTQLRYITFELVIIVFAIVIKS